MKWLFSRKGKTSKGTGRGRAKAAPGTLKPKSKGPASRSDEALLAARRLGRRRLLRGAGWAAGLVAAAAGLYFAHSRLSEEVAGLRAATPTVVLDAPPGWLGEARAMEIEQLAAAVVSADPMDRESLAEAAERLSANPWIAAVHRVRRAADGTVHVRASYREPVAVVGAQDGFHLVDREGRRLPGVYPWSQVERLGLPAVVGVATAPPPTGSLWRGEDVRAGIELALLIANQPYGEQVRAVDVTNHGGRVRRDEPQLALVTEGGRVRWGRPVGESGVHEPSAARKLAMLERVAEAYGGPIDAGGQVVDVYLDAPMIHQASRVRYTSGQ